MTTLLHRTVCLCAGLAAFSWASAMAVEEPAPAAPPTPEEIVQGVIDKLVNAKPLGVLMVEEEVYHLPIKSETPNEKRKLRFMFDGQGNARKDVWYRPDQDIFFAHAFCGGRYWESTGKGNNLTGTVRCFPYPFYSSETDSRIQMAYNDALYTQTSIDRILGRNVFSPGRQYSISNVVVAQDGITATYEASVNQAPNVQGKLFIEGPLHDGSYVLREVINGGAKSRYEGHVAIGGALIPSRVEIITKRGPNAAILFVLKITSVSSDNNVADLPIKDHVVITETEWNESVFGEAIQMDWYNVAGAKTSKLLKSVP